MRPPSAFMAPSTFACALLALLLCAAPLAATAQDGAAAAAPNPSSHPDPAPPSAAAARAAPVPTVHARHMYGMDHDPTQGGAAPSHSAIGPAQGASAAPGTRSPDYSDGIGHAPMLGMDMLDNALLGLLRIDQLEAFHGSDANGQAWEAQGWYGNDADKLWLRSEGERRDGALEDASLEAFWNRNVAPFWSTQLGLRHDFGDGPSRTWAAFGVQGLAPYWFEIEATAYIGDAGRTAARLRADYDLRLTQRLILQPEAEVNLYGKRDPLRRIGEGVSDLHLGLRLLYEIRREFAPYLGVVWNRRVGTSADYAREDLQSVLDRRLVAGVRLWF